MAKVWRGIVRRASRAPIQCLSIALLAAILAPMAAFGQASNAADGDATDVAQPAAPTGAQPELSWPACVAKRPN